MSSASKKVVVTGGRGFIGSHVVRALRAEGHHVLVVDIKPLPPVVLPNVEHVVLDITSKESLIPLIEGYDAVIHLAARASVQESLDFPAFTEKINIGGTRMVLEAMHQAHVPRIIFASSCATYGDQEILPLVETMLPKPKSPYALHKLAGEHLLRLAHEIHSTEALSFRFFNVYGIGMDPSGPYASVIGRFLKQHREGHPLTITGDGKQTRDYVHVLDVVDAILKAVDAPGEILNGSVFNLGTGIQTSVNDIADSIGGPREYIAPRIEPRFIEADITRVHDVLDWKPRHMFAQSLSTLMEMH